MIEALRKVIKRRHYPLEVVLLRPHCRNGPAPSVAPIDQLLAHRGIGPQGQEQAYRALFIGWRRVHSGILRRWAAAWRCS